MQRAVNALLPLFCKREERDVPSSPNRNREPALVPDAVS